MLSAAGGPISGSFDNIDLSGAQLADGLSWDISQLSDGGTGELPVVAAIPEPSTFALFAGILTFARLLAHRRRDS